LRGASASSLAGFDATVSQSVNELLSLAAASSFPSGEKANAYAIARSTFQSAGAAMAGSVTGAADEGAGPLVPLAEPDDPSSPQPTGRSTVNSTQTKTNWRDMHPPT
jgi:hypothetical protein